MGQSIHLKIAGKEYQLVAPTPEKEGAMRRAAMEINSMMASYDEKFPDRTMADKLVFVALGQAVAKYSAEQRFKDAETEAEALTGDLSNYLKDKENR